MSLFEDDIQLNEHQVAWYSKDWTAVQSAADSFKEKAENEFFEIIGAINNKTKCYKMRVNATVPVRNHTAY